MTQPIFNLNEAARILEVAPSTLRYWDSQGLIDIERNPQNNYRQLSMRSLIAAGDVAFYRDLGVPMKQLVSLASLSEADFDAMLTAQSHDVDKQIAHLQETKRRIERQRSVLAQAVQLEGRPLHEAAVPFRRIARMDMHDPTHWELISHDLQRYGVYIEAGNPTEALDGVIDEGELAAAPALWDRDDSLVALECLLKAPEDDYTASNAPELFDAARAAGYQPHCMVGSFLVTFNDNGTRIDRNRAWILCYPNRPQ